MWLGEQITERGIGNGISLIIFIGIIARFPEAIIDEAQFVWVGTRSILLEVIARGHDGRRDRGGHSDDPRPAPYSGAVSRAR